MIKSSFLSFLLVCISSIALSQPICGTKTIGGAAPDYSNFTDALNDLVANGLCGDVTFIVRDGVYTEQLNFPAISGVSATDTILFKSESNDSAAVILQFAGTAPSANYVVKLVASNHITFSKMTFKALGTDTCRVFDIQTGTQNFRVTNSVIEGGLTGFPTIESALIYSFDSGNDSIRIANNVFKHGGYGYFSGGVNNATIIVDNEFNDQYLGGVFTGDSPNLILARNTLLSTRGYAAFTGVYMNGSSRYVIRDNVFKIPQAGTGMNLLNGTANGKRALVANNMISVGNDNVTGGQGIIGIASESNDSIMIVHNSILMVEGAAGTNYPLMLYQAVENTVVANNVVVNLGNKAALAYIVPAGSCELLEHNCYFTLGSELVSDIGSPVATLADWQPIYGYDMLSVNLDPNFTDTFNLSMNSCGTPSQLQSTLNFNSVVPEDMFGNVRSATPYMGAHQVTPVPPLAGNTYTIGGSSPDYTTVDDAIDALNCSGIAGPVTFEVRDGTYNVNKTIGIIAGSSAANTVLIKSESGDSSTVTFEYDAVDANDNFILNLNGATYLSLQELSFKTLDTNNNTAINIIGNSQFISIKNCDISTIETTVNSTDGLIDLPQCHDVTIENNYIHQGTMGVFLFPLLGQTSENIIIQGNEFRDQNNTSIAMSMPANAQVINNFIKPDAALTMGIYLSGTSGITTISGNHITQPTIIGNGNQTGGTVNCFNNLLLTESSFALQLGNCKHVNVVHNTISSMDSIYVIDLGTVDSSQVKNNIIVNKRPDGHLFKATSLGLEAKIDYNGYHITGAKFATLDGNDMADLPSWGIATQTDNNSIMVDPQLAPDGWHLTNCSPRSLISGFDFSTIAPLDIESDARSQTPWAGADEHIYPSPIYSSISGTIVNATDTIHSGRVGAFQDLTGDGIYDTRDSTLINFSDGSYLIDSLIPGNYYMRVVPHPVLEAGNLPTYYNLQSHWDDAITVQVDTCGVSLDIQTLEAVTITPGNGNISGYIFHGSTGKTILAGDPIPGLEIMLDKTPPSGVVAIDTTDIDGFYSFEDLPEGFYTVFVNTEGHTMDTLHTVTITDMDTLHQNKNYGMDTTENVVFVYDTTIISGQTENEITYELKAFPNPATDVLYIESNNPKANLSIQLLDMKGVIHSQAILASGNRKHQFSLTNISSGFYFLHIQDGTRTKIIKLVKR